MHVLLYGCCQPATKVVLKLEYFCLKENVLE
jgi:hypothetical protein